MKRRGVVVGRFWRSTFELVRFDLRPASNVHLRASASRTICGVSFRKEPVDVGRVVLHVDADNSGTRFLLHIGFLCYRCSDTALSRARTTARLAQREAAR